ncbi:U-box domain-containing protein 34-like [Dorcoceras hygrometricum]|uniref:U-box domain-containing protein 34-like n=1 Tax=Dorcoceras hygrometricum TaxID=472368 RepID=A0A2Z7A7S1_9LAMI|nr:U-box domain-containing protein 34-like [Dorcoceras hygrometricum]
MTTQRFILLNTLITSRGPRLLSGTSSSPTSTSPRRHLNNLRLVSHNRYNIKADNNHISPKARQSDGQSNQISPSSTNTTETSWKLKYVTRLQKSAQLKHTNLKLCTLTPTARTLLKFYTSTQTQQLRTSPPTLIQGLKWVAIERAKQGEFSATKIRSKQRRRTAAIDRKRVTSLRISVIASSLLISTGVIRRRFVKIRRSAFQTSTQVNGTVASDDTLSFR